MKKKGIVLAAAALFVCGCTYHQSVTIKSVPERADIYINTVPKGKAPVTEPLITDAPGMAMTGSGTHTILARMEGYEDEIVTLKSPSFFYSDKKPFPEVIELKLRKKTARLYGAAPGAAERPPSEDIRDIPDFQAGQRESDLAIVIGIENYQSLPKAEFAKSDAALMRDYLKALGFRERNIQYIAEEKATKSSIEKSLEGWIRNTAKKESRVFVYYSGHGAPDPATGEAYLVPYDGDPSYLSITGYPLKRLYDNLGRLQVAEVTVVLDACFTGAGGRSVLAQGTRPIVIVADKTALPRNMAVLTAAGGAQISTSSPEKGHGLFTFYFLKALKHGKRNLAEIYEYMKPHVEDDARALNVQQSPTLNPAPEKVSGRFNLRR